MKEGHIFSWISPGIELRDTSKYGKGVFAARPIKKDDTLIIFGGYVLTREEEEQLPESIRDIAIQIAPNHVMGIVSEDQLAATDYVNHSCNPNAGIRGQISLVAIRDIKMGEEITFDYGTVLFRIDGAPKYELSCLCGAPNCRKKITQEDWMIPELQEKYKDYFPYYIKEKINNL